MSLPKRLAATCLALCFVAACGGNGAENSSSLGSLRSSTKALTSFAFPSVGATGTISESTKSIAVSVPFGTNVTALVATFSTTGTEVRVGAVTQTSGVTANDFTGPVVYTVIAWDGTSANYTVTVTVLPFSSPTTKAMLTFELAGVSGAIDESAKTITVVLPPDGTDLTAQIATFTHNGASVSVGAAVQTSGVTVNDFTSPVAYTVTALDSSTVTYTVTVSVLKAPKLLTAFSFTAPLAIGVIDQGAKTVLVSIPVDPTTSLVSLIATFETTAGAIVKVGSVVQTSGTTPNDFSAGPVAYTVTAPDGLTENYAVTITVLPPSLVDFSFASIPAVGVLDHAVGAVALTVPARTDITSLVSTFTVTNTTDVQVSAVSQVSGATANDFTSPVIYTLATLTGAGGVPKNYTVTVTVAPGLLNLPQTGQITSYSTPTVDDGALRKGIAWPDPRFTEVSSGTGTALQDNLTGLVWARDGSTPTFGPCAGGPMTWAEAFTYVACLNSNNYLGNADWRLPNVSELVSLVTAGQPDVYAWLNAKGFIGVQGNFYHSSTTDAVLATQVRIVNMVTGNVVVGAKTDSLGVMPVRGGNPSTARAPLPMTGQTVSYAADDDGSLQIGIAWPSPRFTDPAGLTPITGDLVVDQLTGLMWPKDGLTGASSTCQMSGTWQAAIDYVTCLNASTFLGYNDWRLPNVNEMTGLLNAGEADSSAWLNTQGFVNVDGNAYWTSTTDPTVTDNAWLIFMVGGDKVSTTKSSSGSHTFRALPVRSGY